MDAETCTSPAANVLESACGLYSYLSSGRSSAIAISFLPISFHCSSTASEGPGAGFGGSFFAASCPSTGNAANPTAKATPATHFRFFISSLLSCPRLSRCSEPGRALIPSDGPPRQSFPRTGFARGWRSVGDHLTQETAMRHTKFHTVRRAKLDVYTRG